MRQLALLIIPIVWALPIPTFEAQLTHVYPHNRHYFTQGIARHKDHIYESTGHYGQSRLIRYHTPGITTTYRHIPAHLFAEGIASNNHALYQLTWREGITLIHNETTQSILQLGQGWGLTFDGAYLIQSDGSNALYYRTASLQPRFQIQVHYQNHPIGRLNDLTIHQGYILANVWYQDNILVILPQDGTVIGSIDLSFLRQVTPGIGKEDVLNGICSLDDNTLLVTGKNWPSFYQLNIDLHTSTWPKTPNLHSLFKSL